MKPLPHPFDVADPNEAYAAALLKHAQPLEPSAARKRRVRMALERTAMKRPRPRVSGPVIAGLVLFGATAASATLPHFWKRLQRDPLDVAAVATVVPESKGAYHRPLTAPATPMALSAPTLPEPTLPPVESLLAASPLAAPPPAALPLPARKQTPSKSRPLAELSDPPASAALMVEAMRERRAGNLVRARDLSSEYRVKYPGGALQEEALALSIEAAASLGDDEARRLSALYLQRYPHGRFRAQALHVVGSSR